VFPLTCFFIHRGRKSIYALSGALVISNLVWLSFYGNDTMWTNGWTAWLRGMSGFLLGACVWVFQTHSPKSKYQEGYMTDIALGLFFSLNVLFSGVFKQPPWLLILLLPLVINGLCTNKGMAARLLVTPGAVMLGNISYSVYLLHPLVLLVMKQACAMGLVRHAFIYMALSTTIVFLMATLTYFRFEVPARDFLKRKLSGSRVFKNLE
jgi:peptidoglycan/LPS O-acetylase OafA/YrhL